MRMLVWNMTEVYTIFNCTYVEKMQGSILMTAVANVSGLDILIKIVSNLYPLQPNASQ